MILFSLEVELTIDAFMNDESVLRELGRRLAQRRIALEYTQSELAAEAGISKRTVERIENGGSTQITSLIRILRGLKLLEGLDDLIPETGSRPLELLRSRGIERRRASSKKSKNSSEQTWTWGDER